MNTPIIFALSKNFHPSKMSQEVCVSETSLSMSRKRRLDHLSWEEKLQRKYVYFLKLECFVVRLAILPTKQYYVAVVLSSNCVKLVFIESRCCENAICIKLVYQHVNSVYEHNGSNENKLKNIYCAHISAWHMASQMRNNVFVRLFSNF